MTDKLYHIKLYRVQPGIGRKVSPKQILLLVEIKFIIIEYNFNGIIIISISVSNKVQLSAPLCLKLSINVFNYC